ncbi:unnamed protein product [Lactuca saligna]|uniref:DUF7912 domain-containing protein n=1 Tax=Lactuca saligna TaxID=75948 RepID=A0AA35ZF71_LACSI|nr:unnamed protein product [Lactuca saligna]
MGSISNNHTSLLVAPHSYSLAPRNPFYPQFINFPKTPFCDSCPLLSSSLINLIANRTPRCVVTAKKKTPSSEPVLSPSIVEEVSEDDDFEEFDDDEFDDDYDIEDEYAIEDAETKAGDGGGGGGISLAGTKWDKQVLEMAEQVSMSFDGELGIYAFKTLQNSAIRVRIERLTNKSGSPTMEDIEAFAKAYRERLNEAEADGSIPDISIEVSSPGLERVVRVPQDLERFKDRSMYVRYTIEGDDEERDGVLRLESFDLETKRCIWGLADVKVNREKAGKGRPLTKKQKEWRLDTPFQSLVLVRIYADF